jgi:hypothetical protein
MALLKQMEDAGQPIPEKMQEPVLIDGLGIFLDVFCECATERYQPDMPIPASKVREWILSRGITDEELISDILWHVRQMDLAYMEFRSRKVESAAHGRKRR